MKRLFDLVFTIIFIVIISPIILIVAVLIKCNIDAPIIFSQTRIGKNGTQFRLFKFRTMLEMIDGNGTMLPDEQRITRLGRILRQSSLDEIPGFLNVLKGEMSVVGPRPQDAKYLTRYSQHQMRRHEVNPGITGWAQINGRNAISWDRRFELDVWYVDNRTWQLDLEICFKTISVILNRKNVSAPGYATMPEFLKRDSIDAAE